MADLYTRAGRPLRRRGNDLFARSGRHVARIRGTHAFGPDGRYVGTIVGDRLVYRAIYGSRISAPYAPRVGSPSARANRAGSALYGDEPPIPD
mgnify:CR=1 FL=1